MYYILIYIIIDLYFVRVSARKSKSYLNSFSLSSFIYFISYVYGSFYYFGITSFHSNDFIAKPEYANEAIKYVLMFKLVINISYLFFIHKVAYTSINVQKLNLKFKQKKYSFNSFLLLNLSFWGLIIFSFILFTFGIGDFSNLIEPKTRFFGDEALLNTYKIGAIFAFLIIVVIHYRYKKSYVSLVISLLLYMIYPMAISSRSVAIPFGILFVMNMFLNKNEKSRKINNIIYPFLIVIFYSSAIYLRSKELGIYNYIVSFPEFIYDLPSVFLYVVSTISGFSTLTLTLYGIDKGFIELNSDLIHFIPYISPLPSFLLPEFNYYNYQSLTPHFNFPIGINSDMISESILWLGKLYFLFAIILGYIVAKVEYLKHQGYIGKLIYFSCILFFAFSSVASIRSSSRMFCYSILIWFLVKIFFKISRNIKN